MRGDHFIRVSCYSINIRIIMSVRSFIKWPFAALIHIIPCKFCVVSDAQVPFHVLYLAQHKNMHFNMQLKVY